MKQVRDSYLAIDPEVKEMIEKFCQQNETAKIHYFDTSGEVSDIIGSPEKIVTNEAGVFLIIKNDSKIRLDKIITYGGKPGPAYDQYDYFANVCLACEDLGQFGA